MPRGHVLPDHRSIAHLRGEAGLTQHDIALLSGYGRRTISKIENGKPTTAPTLSAIATVLAQTLGRAVTLADLVQAPQAADTPHEVNGQAKFVVAQQILSLHLPSLANSTPRQTAIDEDLAEIIDALDEPIDVPTGAMGKRGLKASRSRAVLIDTTTLLFSDVGLSDVNFSYVNFGGAMSGHSLSHPDTNRKIVRWPAGEKKCQCGAGDRVVRVTLSHFFDRPVVVQNEIEYRGAFRHANERRFYAEIVYPTDSLTMLLHFPADRRFDTLIGRCQRQSTGPMLPVAEPPISLAPGRVAYWRIANPAIGERYELSWK